MTKTNDILKHGPLCAALLTTLYFSFVTPGFSQDGQIPAKSGIQLEFVPPPMEGTISLGIYDSTGRLIRVLHQEAPQSEFTAAFNGLITFWDGKDGAGKLMPAGTYRAHGYLAGEMNFQGEAFLCNDWIVDEKSPRIRRITGIRINGSGLLEESYETIAGGGISGSGASELAPPTPMTSGVKIAAGKLLITKNNSERSVQLAEGETALDACMGFGDTAWAIVKSGSTAEVRAYSRDGEFIRRLAIAPEEPPPVSIKASPRDETIYLLEENDRSQRVRTLTLSGSASQPVASGTVPGSVWKVTSSKAIHFSDTLEQARDFLKFPGGKPFVPQDKIRVTLLPNPLEQEKIGTVDITVGTDQKGSFLKAGDGLPLCRVSETPNLRWAAMARIPDSKIIVIFQSDGSVVEEFKADKLANMMSFDCGDFIFDPAKIKDVATP